LDGGGWGFADLGSDSQQQPKWGMNEGETVSLK